MHTTRRLFVILLLTIAMMVAGVDLIVWKFGANFQADSFVGDLTPWLQRNYVYFVVTSWLVVFGGVFASIIKNLQKVFGDN